MQRSPNSRNIEGRKPGSTKSNMVYCSQKEYSIVAHVHLQEDLVIRTMEKFLGMLCFEISHSVECSNILTKIYQNGKFYHRSLPMYQLVHDIEL